MLLLTIQHNTQEPDSEARASNLPDKEERRAGVAGDEKVESEFSIHRGE